MGNDTVMGIAASQGNFELNVYMPVMAYNYLQSVRLLADGITSFSPAVPQAASRPTGRRWQTISTAPS